MALTNETLARGIIILTALTGAIVAFCMALDSGINLKGPLRGSFLSQRQHQLSPVPTGLERSRKTEKNWEKITLSEKDNLNLNKNNPIKTPFDVSPHKPVL